MGFIKVLDRMLRLGRGLAIVAMCGERESAGQEESYMNTALENLANDVTELDNQVKNLADEVVDLASRVEALEMLSIEFRRRLLVDLY